MPAPADATMVVNDEAMRVETINFKQHIL